jgi:hypothetical protein
MMSLDQANERNIARFRRKLSAAIVLVISAITALALYLTQRNVAATAERGLQQNFQAELSGLHKVQELRHAALAERCRVLAEKPRIHAALEDNALDLLYPSAKDELRDLMRGEDPSSEQAAPSLHAKFYRFLNGAGAVLSPTNPTDVGKLGPATEAQLALKKLPETQQIGYVWENTRTADETIDEVVSAPIFSTETGDVISALVVGFKPFEVTGKGAGAGMKSGIWVNGRLHLPSLSKTAQTALGNEVTKRLTNSNSVQNFVVRGNAVPQLLFYKRLNPDSLFPPAYEICVYPLADSMAQLHRLRTAPARRICSQPFPRGTLLCAGRENGGGLRGEPRATKTCRSCARLHQRGAQKIDKVFRQCVASVEESGDGSPRGSRSVVGTRRFQTRDLRGALRASPSNSPADGSDR